MVNNREYVVRPALGWRNTPCANCVSATMFYSLNDRHDGSLLPKQLHGFMSYTWNLQRPAPAPHKERRWTPLHGQASPPSQRCRS
eukprot:scaffold67542_cov63-Phaeocystis_antarctica.AAC.5